MGEAQSDARDAFLADLKEHQRVARERRLRVAQMVAECPSLASASPSLSASHALLPTAQKASSSRDAAAAAIKAQKRAQPVRKHAKPVKHAKPRAARQLAQVPVAVVVSPPPPPAEEIKVQSQPQAQSLQLPQPQPQPPQQQDYPQAEWQPAPYKERVPERAPHQGQNQPQGGAQWVLTNVIATNGPVDIVAGRGPRGPIIVKRFKGDHPEVDRRFGNALEALVEFRDDPGIIGLLDVRADDGLRCLVLEAGTMDFMKLLIAEKKVPECTARILIRQVLETLARFHAAGFAHRDVKLDNVVIARDGNAKLIDFGDAVRVGHRGERCFESMVGTPCYLAPERWRVHQGWESQQSDIFAVGVMAFELVTGVRCFPQKRLTDLRAAICAGAWEWPRDINVSVACHDFVSLLLDTDTKRRFTAREALVHPWMRPRTDFVVEW